MSSSSVPLGDLVDITSGFAFSSKNFSETNGTPIIRIRDVVRGFTKLRYDGEFDKKFLAQDDDLLVSMDGEFRVAEWRGGPALINQRVCRIGPKNGKLDRRFLRHFLPKELKEIEDKTPFVTVKHLSVKTIREIECPNIDINEQRRIAAILDKADDIRRKRQQALALADEFLKSVFLEMFGDPAKLKSEGASTIGDECDLYAGNSLPSGSEFEGQVDGYLLLKVSDLNADGNEYVINQSKLWIPSSVGVRESLVAPKGAIVFPKRGGAISTNKKRVLGRPAVLDPNLMAVAPKPNSEIDEAYLRSWFIFIDLVTISSGSSVPQLNKQDVAPLPIIVPTSTERAKYAEVRLNVANHVEKCTSGLAHADCLFASLSQRAFRGEL